jgi:hypothetical protein
VKPYTKNNPPAYRERPRRRRRGNGDYIIPIVLTAAVALVLFLCVRYLLPAMLNVTLTTK